MQMELDRTRDKPAKLDADAKGPIDLQGSLGLPP